MSELNKISRNTLSIVDLYPWDTHYVTLANAVAYVR